MKSTNDPMVDELLRGHAAEVHAKRHSEQSGTLLHSEGRTSSGKPPASRQSGTQAPASSIPTGAVEDDSVAQGTKRKVHAASVDPATGAKRAARVERELEAHVAAEEEEHERNSSAFFASLRASIHSEVSACEHILEGGCCLWHP